MIRKIYNFIMRKNKDGSKDRRFKENNPPKVDTRLGFKKLVYRGKPVSTKPGENVEIDPPEKVEVFNTEYERPKLPTANELHSRLLRENGLEQYFDVIEGRIETKHGIIELNKPHAILRTRYVRTK